MKKNGFVSTSIIYTFFIVFLLLMVFLLNSYSRVRYLLEEIRYDVKNNFVEVNGADINIYFMVEDIMSGEHELKSDMPRFGYNYDSGASYCVNNSDIRYEDGNIVVEARQKDSCYAYFNYEQINSDIELNLFKEDKEGTTSHDNGKTYTQVYEIPDYNYELDMSITKCDKSYASINNELLIISTGPTVCNAYYNLRVNEDDIGNVNIYIYKEAENGLVIDGGTTGIKYVRTSNIPSTGYYYTGNYKCTYSGATVTFENGTFIAESIMATTCNVFFNKTSDDDVVIKYFLETEINSGIYVQHSRIPDLGYIYNPDPTKSKCENGGTIDASGFPSVQVNADSGDVCEIYADITFTDIKVLIYVWNSETGRFELGDVPYGLRVDSMGCTNGASIEYDERDGVKVTSDMPTVCEIRFR